MGGVSRPVGVNDSDSAADDVDKLTTSEEDDSKAEVTEDAVVVTAEATTAPTPEVAETAEGVGAEEEEQGDAVGVEVERRPLLGRDGVLVGLYAVVAMVLTWPLVLHLGSAMTYGGEPTTTVPLFNLWTMEWNRLQIGDLYAHYWNAPIFHPTEGAFALSEPQPLTGLVFAPISWLSGNPLLGYNVVALIILTLNGYAGARLARALGVAPGPAALVGVMTVGLPFVAHQMGVLQLTAVFPLFLLVETVLRWAPQGGRGLAVRLGLWLAVTFLTCGYYGLFAVVGIGLVSLVLARRQWLSWQRLADLAAAGVTFAVLALPILLAQARYTSDYHRTDDVIRDLSAATGDYWQMHDETLGASLVPWLQDSESGHGLYPGTALIVLAAAGLLFSGRRPTGVDDQRRPWFLFAGVCFAWLLSRGLKLSVFGFHPYEIVRSVPGYDELRSPFRFAVLGELFLVGLAAYGLDALWRRDRRIGRGRLAVKTGPVLATVVVVLGVAEVSITPVRLFEPETTAEWAEWLDDNAGPPTSSIPGAARAPSGLDDRTVVAFVPYPADGRVVEFRPTAERMVQAVDAGLTTVSGYSGLFPEEYGRLADVMGDYPTEEADALLREYGVQYLVVDTTWLNRDSEHVNWLVTRHFEVYNDGETAIFQLV